MDRFLNSLILPKLNEEEFNNISRTKTNKIRIALKSFPVKKSLEPERCTAEFYHHPKEDLHPILLKLLKTQKKNNQTLFYDAIIIVIQKPGKDTSTMTKPVSTKANNFQTNIPEECRSKNLE